MRTSIHVEKHSASQHTCFARPRECDVTNTFMFRPGLPNVNRPTEGSILLSAHALHGVHKRKGRLARGV